MSIGFWDGTDLSPVRLMILCTSYVPNYIPCYLGVDTDYTTDYEVVKNNTRC